LVTQKWIFECGVTKMAKITKPLTNTEVKQAKPRDKDYTLLDGGGLQLWPMAIAQMKTTFGDQFMECL